MVKLNAAGTGILYAAYFGGRGPDSARAIALDAAGNAYVAGYTYSSDFPTTGGVFRSSAAGQQDAFVLKLDPSGRTLLYATLLGGAGNDIATGIAVDTSGNAYLAGYTSSLDFPATLAAAQTTNRGGFYDAFAAKFNASGSALLYATYLGGSGNDTATGIAVDAGGAAYLTGFTDSSDFPVRNALQATQAGQGDGFVTKLSAAGDTFSYSTYLGGRGLDTGNGIAVDAGGNAYIAGGTISGDFPVTAGAAQTAHRGQYDGFLAALGAAGSTLLWSTYIGGTGSDQATSVAVDATGKVYLGGFTMSADFPVTGTGRRSFAGVRDAFAAAFSSAKVEWSTCLGGAGEDTANALALGPTGSVYLAGTTLSPNFPVTTGAYGSVISGGTDVFVAQLHFDTAPTVLSMLPASASGSRQVFQFTFSDSNGFQNLDVLQIIIGTGTAGGYACYVQYERARNLLWLVNDTVTAVLGPVSPGSAASVQNGQCTLNGAGSAASASGISLTLSVDLKFAPAFAGTKAVYGWARNASGLISGWQAKGEYTVLPNRAPVPVSVSPASGSGAAGTFRVLFEDADGYDDISVVQFQITSGGRSCYVQFERSLNLLWLVNDTFTAPIGPLTPGGAGAAQNSQCVLTASGSSVSSSGTSLSLGLALSFNAQFAGSKSVYAWVIDGNHASSDWQVIGVWNVVAAASQAPAAVSVNPSGGSSWSQQLTFLFSDPGGYTDIDVVQVIVNSGLSGGYACYVQYERAANRLWLVNDTVTAPLGPVVPGSTAAAENSQCTLHGSASAVSGSGNNLALTLAFTFKSGFAGVKQIYAWARDRSGLGCVWEAKGTWTATPGETLAAAPTSGSGLSQLFSFSSSSAAGYADLDVLQAMIGSNPNGGYACWLQYDRSHNQLWLVNDTVTAPLGPLTPGTAGSAQNSQCTVDAGASTVAAFGPTLVLSVRLNFKTAFTGSKGMYLWSRSTTGAVTGWKSIGAWTVTP